MNMKFQFSLRQLLLATTLLAVCLGTGKWCYFKYFDRIFPLGNEDYLYYSDGPFCYIGKRVSFCGRYQYIGSDSSYQVVWFGNHPIAVVGIWANRLPLSPIPDGASISVTGRLTYVPTNMSQVVPIKRRTWWDEYGVYHQTCAQQIIVHCINVEEVSAAPAGDVHQNGERGVREIGSHPIHLRVR